MDFAALSSMLNGSKSAGGASNLGGMAGNRGMGAGAGGMPAAAAAAAGLGKHSSAELSQHAEHMWKFLDEMAESDPEGYKKFIAQQMQEVAEEKKKKAETEAMFTPTPAFVIYTRQTSPSPERTVYLNICSSPQVPGLQTKARQPAKGDEPMSEILIPLSVGAISEQEHQGKKVFTSDVVFHPSVIQRSTTDLTFKLFMLELALQHLEEDEKVVLHRGYKFESPSVKYIGSSGAPRQQKTEAELAREEFVSKMKKEREEKIKQMQTNKGGKEIVMPSLSKTEQAKKQFDEESIHELKLPTAAGGVGGKKKVLIEDLTPDEGGALLSMDTDISQQPKPSARETRPAISLASSSKSLTSSSSLPLSLCVIFRCILSYQYHRCEFYFLLHHIRHVSVRVRLLLEGLLRDLGRQLPLVAGGHPGRAGKERVAVRSEQRQHAVDRGDREC